MFEVAGFDQPKLEAVEAPVWMATDVDDALRFFEDEAGASLRAMASGDTVNRVVETLRELLGPYATPDGVLVPAAGWVIAAYVGRTTS
jgi:hypothetical protein